MNGSKTKSSCVRFGVICDWFQSDYQSGLLSGIDSEAKRNCIQVIYFMGRAPNSPLPDHYHYNIVYDTALDASLDGIVILPMFVDYVPDTFMTSFISRFAPVPLVTIGFKAASCSAILSNNTEGFRLLLKHLTDDHGYRRLAFLNGPDMIPGSIEKREIYESALLSKDLRLDSSLISTGFFTFLSGEESIRTLLDERGFKPGRDFEVLVCANDQMAWGAINELERRGFKVPRDVAVTGLDDILSSLFPMPELTTVSQQMFEIGKAAISRLLAHDSAKTDIVINSELVIRGSCGCPVHGTGKSSAGKDSIKASSEEGKKSDEPEQTAHEGGSQGQNRALFMLFLDTITVMNSLKAIKTTSALQEWLENNLRYYEIESACIFLYSEEPSRTAGFIARYGRTDQKHREENKMLPLRAVFDDALPRSENRSYCILPLFYEHGQHVLLACEVNPLSILTCDRLDSPIGSSIKSMLLVDELSILNLKRVETNDILRKANEQKTQFFVNIAHEMRTPLTLIKNYLERCIARFPSDPDLAIVKQNMDIMLENMLNFLDAERLEKGTMPYSHDAFLDLSESTQKKCTLFRVVAEKKNIAINLRKEDGVIIKIDPAALDRILNNLIDNAVRYTQSGGNVSIEVKRSGERAILCVSDNGPGIPADTLAHLFEPNYELSKKRSNTQGIGVGLSIVKKIVDDLGASMEAANGKDGGAVFTLAFPACQEASPSRRMSEIPNTEPRAILFAETSVSEDNIAPGKYSILVVDDNVLMLDFLKTSLKTKYNVYLASSAQSALVKLKSIDRPGLIISDVMMDVMDGHSFLAALSGMEEYSDIPFIFLTAASSKDEELRGLAGGAIDYIKKPFSIEELDKKIESIIALRNRMKKSEVVNIRKSIESIFSNIESEKNRTPAPTFDSLCRKYRISAREKVILKHVLDGLLNKEIASKLHQTQRMVEYHITSIFRKVGVTKKYDLLAKFRI